jgi:Mn2+/Fe2+ NRAMP family transporter
MIFPTFLKMTTNHQLGSATAVDATEKVMGKDKMSSLLFVLMVVVACFSGLSIVHTLTLSGKYVL